MTQEIVPKFPSDQRPAWEEAANAWRLPFWDWGTTTSVPDLAKYPTIHVPTTDGKGEESIPNPLYQYRVPTNEPMSKYDMANFTDPWVEKGDMLFVGLEFIGYWNDADRDSSENALALAVGPKRTTPAREVQLGNTAL